MKTIDLRDHGSMRLTCLSYGSSGSGKTQWAATWPRPRFLADAVEGGWETLRWMERETMWEPENMTWPQVRAIESYQDMIQQVHAARDEVLKSPAGATTPHTLVIDSLTFFSRCMEDMFRTQYAAEIERNKYLLWDKIKTHLQHFMIETHKIPGLNVVWICLANTLDEGRIGAPLLSGQMAQLAPAACNLMFYHNTYQPNPQTAQVYEIRTRKYGIFPARGRTGNRLPDPMEATYKAMMTYLAGCDVGNHPQEIPVERTEVMQPVSKTGAKMRRVVR